MKHHYRKCITSAVWYKKALIYSTESTIECCMLSSFPPLPLSLCCFLLFSFLLPFSFPSFLLSSISTLLFPFFSPRFHVYPFPSPLLSPLSLFLRFPSPVSILLKWRKERKYICLYVLYSLYSLFTPFSLCSTLLATFYCLGMFPYSFSLLPSSPLLSPPDPQSTRLDSRHSQNSYS